MKVQVKVYRNRFNGMCYLVNDQLYGFIHDQPDITTAMKLVLYPSVFVPMKKDHYSDRFPNGLEDHYVTTLEFEV